MAAISPWRPTMQNHCAKLLRAALTASLVLVAIAGAAVAGPLEDALAARDRGDDATALRLIRPLADQGNAEAQYNLGIMYVTGRVPRTVKKLPNCFASQPTKGMPQRSTILASCTAAAGACRRIMVRLRSGIDSPLTKVMSTHCSISAQCTNAATAYRRTTVRL